MHQEELPKPTASLECSRVIVEALLSTVPRQQGAKFLENLARVIGDREELASVVPIKRTVAAQEAARAEREALAALRQMIAVWIARLPPK